MTHFRRRFYRFNLFSSHPKNTGNSQTERPVEIDGSDVIPESLIETFTLINRVQFALYTEYGRRATGINQDSNKMIALYNNADPETQATLDHFLTALCGFDMRTLQNDSYMAYLYDFFREELREKGAI